MAKKRCDPLFEEHSFRDSKRKVKAGVFGMVPISKTCRKCGLKVYLNPYGD